jgi:hypothetical protein
MTPDNAPGTAQDFPGGVDRPMYRVAFQAWMVLFLLLICAGLLNYLGITLRG